MIKGIGHIGIAVSNVEEAAALYSSLLGAKPAAIETIPDEGLKSVLIPVGEDIEIELVEPIDPAGGIAKFVEKKGEGLHHICLEVDDIDQVMKSFVDNGIELISREARTVDIGRIAYAHPRSTRGVLIELLEKRETAV